MPATSRCRRPAATGALRAARRALVKAGIDAAEIDLVIAHATSTPEGDMEELAAIRTLLGDRGPQVSVTATKSSIGHTLGAAGAIASVAAILAMRDGRVPPTSTSPTPTRASARWTSRRSSRATGTSGPCLVNAFGFGGQNSALVFRRWTA